MAKIPPHIIEDIMQTARIEEVIGEFVNLKRAGSNLKGLSPFTDERTPSFVVSPAKQIFKCFSSGKGGTVVTFLMEKEHYSYPEALIWLANKYGIQLPEDKPATAEELAAISERESLYIINDFARDHFSENLHSTEEGKNIGLSYFVERGFRPDIIKAFQLGYCLNSGDDFTAAALKKGYNLTYLERVGLTKSKDDRHFDFFRGRVIFPIHSVSGRVLGFGARTLLNDKKTAKYFNSPESIIYNKSQILYGLYFAKGDIIKYDQCYLCEGYTDVISLYQAGITNVVSSSGTALTKEQIRLIKRYTKNICILYDGDAAGIKASFRGIDLILEEGMNVKVVLFPEGEDPDSYSKKTGTSELERFLHQNAKDFISFKAEILLDGEGADPLKRAELIKEIVHSVSLIPDQITRNVYIQNIAGRFSISEQVLTAELHNLRRNQVIKENDLPEFSANLSQPVATQIDTTSKTDASSDHFEYDLMRILVLYGAIQIEVDQMNEKGEKFKAKTSVTELIHHELNEDELNFEVPLFNKMYAEIIESLTNNTLLRPSHFKRSDDQEIVRFVSEIEMNDFEISVKWFTKYKINTQSEKDKVLEAVISSIYTFKISRVEKRLTEIRTLFGREEPAEEDTHNDLLSELVLLERVKQELSKKTGRIILR